MRGTIRLRNGRLLGTRMEHGKDGATVLASQSTDSGKTWGELAPSADTLEKLCLTDFCGE
jgi:hypothetical protein